MLQAFREHKRWLMFIAMVLIIPSFVVTGIYSYNRMSQSDNAIVQRGEDHSRTVRHGQARAA